MPSRKSSENRPVKDALAAREIAAIGEKHSHTAKDLHLALDAGIPEPALRTKQACGIPDGAAVEKRAWFNREDAIPIEILVHLPIRQEISPPKRASSFSPPRPATA